ncbi:MAG: hypothetical protein ACE5GB_06180 [Acidimicrobiales bacterium]
MTVKVDVSEDGVTVSLDGVDAVWALRRRLVLTADDLLDARVLPRAEARRHRGWRLGGTAVPGVVCAGNYTVPRRRGDRAFWSVYRDDEVLEIETTRAKPRFVVLQHPERRELAERIRGLVAR